MDAGMVMANTESKKVTSYVLHACGICGSLYPIVHNDQIEGYFQCKCETCGAHTDKFKYETMAMRAWNTGQVEVEW